ncbi:MAG: hypothetical protein IJS82_01095 [Paludibacteraceae bacterium]|nr:hypothetical protein [Paludibacteraceae bacterium]
MAQCTFTNGIETIWGAIDSVKEGKEKGYRIVVRRHNYGEGKNFDDHGHKWHELYYYHLHEGAWSEGATNNREMIKAAQRTAHDIEHAALHPEDCDAAMVAEGQYWKAQYAVYRASPAYVEKPYHFYPFVYVTIYRQMRKEMGLE